jgi:hypothetical protein
MVARIKADTLQALDDWKAGKAVRSLELGHVHRMQENPGFGPRIDMSQRIDRDQERAHAYCFQIVGWFASQGAPFPASHEHFEKICKALIKDKGLTAEEMEAAESLAWKALLLGWRKAIDGHASGEYIEVSRSAVSAT